jgi:hypothetical protein
VEKNRTGSLDGLDADRRSEMRLSRAGAAQDDIVGVFPELASVELAYQQPSTSLLAKSKPARSR